MMSSLNDRQKGFEGKFVHDAELVFRAQMRRNRRLGLWAADMMGQSGSEAGQYADALLATALGENGGTRVFDQICVDLQGRAEPAEIRAKMDTLLTEVWQELRDG